MSLPPQTVPLGTIPRVSQPQHPAVAAEQFEQDYEDMEEGELDEASYYQDLDNAWVEPEQDDQSTVGTDILSNLVSEADQALAKIRTFLALSAHYNNIELCTNFVQLKILPEPDMGFTEYFVSSDEDSA